MVCQVHVSQQGAKEKADPAPVVEVSSSSEDTDEEEEEEDEEKDKRKDNNDTVTTEGLKNASKLDSTMLQVDPTTINSKVDSSGEFSQKKSAVIYILLCASLCIICLRFFITYILRIGS